MRRKISEPDNSGSDLPELTAQQSEFVRGVLEGKTLSDAYRAAYDCSSMQPNSIWCEASKLNSNTNVAQWLAAARKAEFGKAVRTKDQHILRLDRLQQIALDTGNVGAAVQAEQLIGKVEGHYKESLDLTVNDPLATLREIAAFAPEIAEQLARDQGIAWETKH